MRKFSCLLIVISMLLTALTLTASADGNGMTFTSGKFYAMKDAFSSAPLTFEAEIKLSKAVSGRAGVIVGSYSGSSQCVNFEIYNNGAPRIYTVLGNPAVTTNIVFSSVDVRTNEFVHLSITLDAANSKAYCYVNGELKETQSVTTLVPEKLNYPCYVGGDRRSGNGQYFKGAIKSVAVFSDIRTASEIKQDASVMPTNDADLMVSYDLGKGLTDLSGNKNDLLLNGEQDVSSELASKGGFTFTKEDMYLTAKAQAKAPATFEAKIYLPKGIGGRGGIIIGNYGSATDCLNFEIHNNGSPRLYYCDKNANVSDFVFDKVDVRTGDWAHIAIVHDPNGGNVKCYLNGKLAQTISTSVPKIDSSAYGKQLAIGGDLRASNERFFLGAVASISMYSDIRTEDEIKADMNSADFSDKELLLSYDLMSAKIRKDVKDCSSTDNDMLFIQRWLDEKEPVTDYEYSFCVVGDTQKMVYDDVINGKKNTDKLYDWIVDNVEGKKIKYVFGLGDITDMDYDSEWEHAKKNILKLDGIVPYSLVRGNHDSSSKINKYFGIKSYKDRFDGFYNSSKLENSYRSIKIGDVNYLMMTLDYGASDTVLSWASKVIEEYHDHRVIITTHAYLFRDGTTLDQKDVCPPATTGGSNNGDHIWNKLISKHENIFLVLSGHDPCDNVVVTQTEGKNGNIVTQMLIDPQGVDAREGSTGMITMLYFGNDGKTVTVETYSTVREMYYLKANQMTIQVPEFSAPNPPADGSETTKPTVSTTEEVTEPDATTQESIVTAPNTTENDVDKGKNKENNTLLKPIIIGIAAAVVVAAVVAVIVVKKKK